MNHGPCLHYASISALGRRSNKSGPLGGGDLRADMGKCLHASSIPFLQA